MCMQRDKLITGGGGCPHLEGFHCMYPTILPQIKNFDAVTVSDSEKLSLVQEVLQITHKTVEAGHSIEHFVSYGIDLMSQLCPPARN